MGRSFSLFAVAVAAVSIGVGCAQAAADGDQENVADGADAIVGGTEARPNAWPGAVAVYYGTLQGCGGSLVAPSWVVTAGHCIEAGSANGGVTSVVIGRHKLSATGGETRSVDRVVRHEGFDKNLDNDIALLHLSTPSTVATVRLVTPADAAAVGAGAKVTVVGWGVTKEDGEQSDVLRQVSLPVISNTKCVTYADYQDITPNQICAGKAGRDSCQGDSGGPLFMTVHGSNVQVGLVSWGIGCARPNAPGVYTRLASYLEWMRTSSGGEIGATERAAD